MRQKINSILAQRGNEEKRIILHIDMNSYFATVEQQARPSLRGKPIAVAGKDDIRSVVAAASIEAKKRGVKTVMSITMAKKICPEIIIVSGDMARYEYVTKQFIKILIDYTPEVEIFSIDEAFLELTANNKWPIKDYEQARQIALEIKQKIKQQIGEWMSCSIGIGPNKTVSKLASDKQKPDGLVIVKPGEVQNFMDTVKLTDICGIAERIERRLNMLGIKTTKDLANFPEKTLKYEFGIYGSLLKMWGKGEDPSPIIPYYLKDGPRSIGHSYTLPKDTFDLREIRRYLYLIADRVGRRARKQNYAGRVISLYIRFYDFTGFYKPKTIQYPVSDSYEIYKICCIIFNSSIYPKAVRLIGISLSGLIKTKNTSYSLIAKQRKIEESLSACDKINNRFGEMSITRAEFMPVSTRRSSRGGPTLARGRDRNFDLKERAGGFLNKEDLELN